MAWHWVVLLAVPVGIVYVYCKTALYKTFKKLGIASPPASTIFGHFYHAVKYGFVESQVYFYNRFKDKKVYGMYDFRAPALYIRDLDMVKEILVKNFSNFGNRRSLIQFEDPFHDSILSLVGERWKRVRNTVTPTFSSSRVKKMAAHIERNAEQVVVNLREKQEQNEEVDLRDICAFFTVDVIASTGFGLELNSMKNPGNPFSVNAKQALQFSPLLLVLAILFPWSAKLFSFLGLHVLNRTALLYLTKTVDQIMLKRQEDGEAGQVNDFLDLLLNSKTEQGEAPKGVLSKSEIHGVALNFIFAGFETVSNTLGYILFLLTNNPQCLENVQAEIDEKIGKALPSFDNVQELTYLDMCVNETLRMYPGGIFVDRVCTKAITIQGITIPKGMPVVVPVYAIHHDPDIWPDPEEFKPDRFSVKEKESRHSFSYLPFGQGPRMCLGMRLGLLELKLAVATILQKFTPVSCAKTVYPIVLIKSLAMWPKDGLWVKLEARK